MHDRYLKTYISNSGQDATSRILDSKFQNFWIEKNHSRKTNPRLKKVLKKSIKKINPRLKKHTKTKNNISIFQGTNIEILVRIGFFQSQDPQGTTAFSKNVLSCTKITTHPFQYSLFDVATQTGNIIASPISNTDRTLRLRKF